MQSALWEKILLVINTPSEAFATPDAALFVHVNRTSSLHCVLFAGFQGVARGAGRNGS